MLPGSSSHARDLLTDTQGEVCLYTHPPSNPASSRSGASGRGYLTAELPRGRWRHNGRWGGDGGGQLAYLSWVSLPSLSTRSLKKRSSAQSLDRPGPLRYLRHRPVGESHLHRCFRGPVLRPLPLDNGALNKPGKLNSCLSPSEREPGLCSQLLGEGGLVHCRGRHSPGLGTRQLPESSHRVQVHGDSVSKDHGKIRIFSAVYIFSDKLVIAGCYRPSEQFSHEAP